MSLVALCLRALAVCELFRLGRDLAPTSDTEPRAILRTLASTLA